jgi:GntR family negative regulator for fad regulon and positive regulator of fabA
MQWDLPIKPAEITEQRIIEAILHGNFPVNGTLPPERELAAKLGVTRPTLREALQRLSRDGWIEIHQGKSTRIRDYWNEGNLNVLSSIAKYSKELPDNFVLNLLQIRELLCPTYTYLAAINKPDEILSFLDNSPTINQSTEDFSIYDFSLHLKLTQCSGNPIFTLILNGFRELFIENAKIYFKNQKARKNSTQFYASLRDAIYSKQYERVTQVAHKTMSDSIDFWKLAN